LKLSRSVKIERRPEAKSHIADSWILRQSWTLNLDKFFNN
jgi:hypothetical protein